MKARLGLLVTLLAAGCSSGSGGLDAAKDNSASRLSQDDPYPTFYCNSPIVTEAVSYAFSSGCLGCGVTDPKFATDAKHSTAAIMDFTLPAGEWASVRAKGPFGGVYSAGSRPGFMARFPEGQTRDGVILTFSIRTYLGDVLQDESPVPTSIRTGGTDTDKTFFYVDTAKPFDTVEFLAKSESGQPGYTAQIYEACWNDDLNR